MKTVELAEIEKLYNDCQVQGNIDNPIRTTLNTGSLRTRLNADYSFIDRGLASAMWSDVTTPSEERY